DPDDLMKAAKAKGPFKVMALVHAETSTGVLQDLSPMRAIADAAGALLLTDCVTSLAGVPIDLDKHGVDAAYSGTQKCLSCPPGLAPISFSDRAVTTLKTRKHPVQSWYLDLNLIANYWGGARAYHHTAPVNMNYAIHEALRLALDEGLEARFARHARHAAALRAGLQAMGLELPVKASERLDPLTLVAIPEGVDDKRVRGRLMSDYGLEIGGGLGQFAGRAWRIGLMGAASTPRNLTLCLSALSASLQAEGFKPKADPLAAAAEVLAG
ncbi:MAG: alanine--glyoxylate aminotransferase family protein, partial [Myxococcales bacterium]|nr:alanine--glyoxylate aminotransferase family protein [Myxococcales bacterium]